MNIYTNKHLKTVHGAQDFIIGEEYVVTGYGEIGEFRGVEQRYIFEQYNEDKMVLVITHDYKRKFAVATNDCTRDDFKKFQAARIVLEKDDLINIVYYGNDDKAPKEIVTLKILGSERRNDELDVFVECVDKFDTLSKPEWATDIVMHVAENYYSRNVPVQLIRKLAYNSSRTIKYGLFRRNDKGELMLERNGVTFILNNNSLAQRDKDGNMINEGLYRFFYSNRFERSAIVYVDGVLVDESHTDFNLNDYMYSKKTTIDIRRSVKKFHTRGGKTYTGILQNNGGMKIVVKLGNDYKLIHLTPSEVEYITAIDEVRMAE